MVSVEKNTAFKMSPVNKSIVLVNYCGTNVFTK